VVGASCTLNISFKHTTVDPKNNRKPTTDCGNKYGLDPLIRIDHTYREYNHLLTVSNFARKNFFFGILPCFIHASLSAKQNTTVQRKDVKYLQST
jgi:hypothetical protein